MKKVLVMDCYDIFLNNVNLIFTKDDDIEVIGKYKNEKEVFDFLRNHTNSIDVIIMDIKRSKIKLIESILRHLRIKYPQIKLIVYSTYDSSFYKSKIKIADSYVCKYDNFSDILSEILSKKVI